MSAPIDTGSDWFEIVDGARRLSWSAGRFAGTAAAVERCLELAAIGVQLPIWIAAKRDDTTFGATVGDLDVCDPRDAVFIAAAAMSWRGSWTGTIGVDETTVQPDDAEVRPWWLLDGELLAWDPFCAFEGGWTIAAPDEEDGETASSAARGVVRCHHDEQIVIDWPEGVEVRNLVDGEVMLAAG